MLERGQAEPSDMKLMYPRVAKVQARLGQSLRWRLESIRIGGSFDLERGCGD